MSARTPIHSLLSSHMSRRVAALGMVALAASLAACGGSDDSNNNAGATATLAVLETTDLHFNVRSYDYFKLAEDKSYGFERTATLVRAARKEFANTLLVDNGDTIQGTALADYEATINPIPCTQQLSMYKAMGSLGFDAGTLGNHEFNYGLPFLNQVLGGGLDVDGVDGSKKCAGAGFPVVLANVVSNKTKKPLVQPYTLLERTLVAKSADGKDVKLPIKIGVIGFTTPGIMNWDKRYLEGKVTTEGAVEAANKYVPELRAKGADIVVALLHGGLDGAAYSPTMENPGLHLSKVAGIDAMVMGHQHGVFPDTAAIPGFKLPGVDHKAGTINGVPAVMASSWGKALGVVQLALQWDGTKWVVNKSASKSELRNIQSKNAAGTTVTVDADPAIAPLIETQHQAAIQYVKTPIGQTDFRMSTLFADVGDPGAIQIVNQAQQAYVAAYIKANLPQYAALPVLSVSAALKHPHTAHREMVVKIGDSYEGVASPIKLSRTPASYRMPPPKRHSFNSNTPRSCSTPSSPTTPRHPTAAWATAAHWISSSGFAHREKHTCAWRTRVPYEGWWACASCAPCSEVLPPDGAPISTLPTPGIRPNGCACAPTS